MVGGYSLNVLYIRLLFACFRLSVLKKKGRMLEFHIEDNFLKIAEINSQPEKPNFLKCKKHTKSPFRKIELPQNLVLHGITFLLVSPSTDYVTK